MRSGDHVLGPNPVNCSGNGKVYDEAHDCLKKIKPFEQKSYRLSLCVIDGKNDLAKFQEEYNELLHKRLTI